MKKESKDFLKTLLITYAIIIAAVYFLDKGALQEILMKPKSKYLIIMDLEDAEHDLRDAERKYREVEREKKILEKWGFGSEIPSELLGELASQRKEVRELKLIVKNMPVRGQIILFTREINGVKYQILSLEGQDMIIG